MNPDDLRRADAIEIVVGQGAKPGGGGMLLGQKISDRVAEMRDLPKGIDQRSACRHPDWTGPDDLEIKIGELREITDWEKPIFVKIGASRTYYDVALAVKSGADVIVLDGMQGGTAATQDVFIEHVGIPILAAIPQAVESLQELGMHRRVQLVVSGGIRSGADVAKALALGADAVSIGVGRADRARRQRARARGRTTRRSAPPPGFYDDWHEGRDPAGISTQDDELAARFDPELGGRRLANYLRTMTLETPDARPRVRQVARPQPRAGGPRRADGRGGGDGARAAGRDATGSPAATGRLAAARRAGAAPVAARARSGPMAALADGVASRSCSTASAPARRRPAAAPRRPGRARSRRAWSRWRPSFAEDAERRGAGARAARRALELAERDGEAYAARAGRAAAHAARRRGRGGDGRPPPSRRCGSPRPARRSPSWRPRVAVTGKASLVGDAMTGALLAEAGARAAARLAEMDLEAAGPGRTGGRRPARVHAPRAARAAAREQDPLGLRAQLAASATFSSQ